jgi:uncharacterized protein YkwD
MCEHLKRRGHASPERMSGVHCSSTAVCVGKRITSVVVLAFIVALLPLLTIPLGHADAHTLSPQDLRASLEESMFSLIIQDRAARSHPAYTWNATLASGARAHSDRMAAGCGEVQQCPGEPAPPTRISNEGVSFTHWGESVGSAGGSSYTADIQQIEQDMIGQGIRGPDYQDLMSTTFTQVGVGVSIDSLGIVWVTEDFIQP